MYLFTNVTNGTNTTPTLRIVDAPLNLFGTSMAAADFNADSSTDLVLAESGNAVAGGSVSTWMLPKHNATYDQRIGFGFWSSQAYTTPTTTGVGLSVVTGDFDGDSKKDFAVGDSAVAAGKVTIWH